MLFQDDTKKNAKIIETKTPPKKQTQKNKTEPRSYTNSIVKFVLAGYALHLCACIGRLPHSTAFIRCAHAHLLFVSRVFSCFVLVLGWHVVLRTTAPSLAHLPLSPTHTTSAPPLSIQILSLTPFFSSCRSFLALFFLAQASTNTSIPTHTNTTASLSPVKMPIPMPGVIPVPLPVQLPVPVPIAMTMSMPTHRHTHTSTETQNLHPCRFGALFVPA